MNWVADIMGLGMALLPADHYREVVAVAYGTVILAVGTALRARKISMGPRALWIPLALISVMAVLSSSSLADALIAATLFGVYLASRTLGFRTVRLLGPTVCLASLSVAVLSTLHGFTRGGGLYSPANYNIASGAIVLGALLYNLDPWDKLPAWLVAAFATIGVFFTGAEEALGAGIILAIYAVARRDWNLNLKAPLITLVVLLAVFTPLGVTQKLWQVVPNRAVLLQEKGIDAATDGRIEQYDEALQSVKLTGNGYRPLEVKPNTVHNIPLRIMYELGPVAALLWIWATGYMLVKTKLRYLALAIIAFAVIDHFLWTQIPIYYWASVGLSTISNT